MNKLVRKIVKRFAVPLSHREFVKKRYEVYEYARQHRTGRIPGSKRIYHWGNDKTTNLEIASEDYLWRIIKIGAWALTMLAVLLIGGYKLL